MAEDRQRSGQRGGALRWGERFRQALAEVESQRDDAVVYLSAIKAVLDVLARGHGTRESGQAIAEVLVHQLAVETCAIGLRDREAGGLGLVGFATQGHRLGGPGSVVGESGWLALAKLVGSGTAPVCFRRLPDGSFQSAGVAELVDEGFLVLPFSVGDEAGGALVLHSLVGPANVFGRARALSLVAEIIGQSFTVSSTRESMQRLCADLEDELGLTRRRLNAQQESLRTQEHNIEQLTQNLIRSNRVKRDFLGTVSHELRTPLNAILGYTGLVRDGLVGDLSEEQGRLLDRVLSNTRNLNALIDDMLFFVQVEADRVLVRREAIPARELVDEVLGSIPERATKERIEVLVDVAAGAETIHADAGIVRRIVFHLLSNAFKFTAEGTVAVAVRPADEPGAVVIVVRDTGEGIPAERVSELFEMFHQADGSTTRRFNGLGMGLSLIQRCVRLLGGHIDVESRPKAGSEFRVCLPGTLAPSDDTRDEAGPSHTIH
jgi:signal transduction histidine kinase